MTENPSVAKTPFFFLLEEGRRLGPAVGQLPSGERISAVYGFSDAGCYERFRSNSVLQTRPYPLVKAYLQTQVSAANGILSLFVLDAKGPDDHVLRASTMQAVLDAHENPGTDVIVTHQLVFNQQTNFYEMEDSE